MFVLPTHMCGVEVVLVGRSSERGGFMAMFAKRTRGVRGEPLPEIEDRDELGVVPPNDATLVQVVGRECFS